MADQAATPALRLDTATTLAFERTRVAYDRTMMASVRTAISLFTFGFAIYKFFQLDTGGGPAVQSLIGTRGFALILIGVGLLSLLLGAFEHWRDLRSLREQYPAMPRSLTGTVVTVVAAVGLCAFLGVIFRL